MTRSHRGAISPYPLFIPGEKYNYRDQLESFRKNELKCDGGYTSDVMDYVYNNIKITGKFAAPGYVYTVDDLGDYVYDDVERKTIESMRPFISTSFSLSMHRNEWIHPYAFVMCLDSLVQYENTDIYTCSDANSYNLTYFRSIYNQKEQQLHGCDLKHSALLIKVDRLEDGGYILHFIHQWR